MTTALALRRQIDRIKRRGGGELPKVLIGVRYGEPTPPPPPGYDPVYITEVIVEKDPTGSKRFVATDPETGEPIRFDDHKELPPRPSRRG